MCSLCEMPFWAMTPGVLATLNLYNRCTERKALPCPGGVFDQPESVMADFDLIDLVLLEERKRRRDEDRARAEMSKPNV